MPASKHYSGQTWRLHYDFRLFLTYGHKWAADEEGWVPPPEAPRGNMGATAPTALLTSTCMDEKEIHSKSTLKRRHLIPETLTDLIVARGSQRADRQVQSEDVYGSSLSFSDTKDTKETNQDKPQQHSRLDLLHSPFLQCSISLLNKSHFY